MSEQRFYLGNNNTTICDKSQGGSDGFNMLTKFEVVDLLNELAEENEQLKKQNIEYEEVQCKIMNYIIDKGLGSEFAKFLREAEDE